MGDIFVPVVIEFGKLMDADKMIIRILGSHIGNQGFPCGGSFLVALLHDVIFVGKAPPYIAVRTEPCHHIKVYLPAASSCFLPEGICRMQTVPAGTTHCKVNV